MFHSKEGVMFANNNAFALSTTPSGVSPFSNTQCLSVMNLPNLGAKRIDLFTCNSAVTPIVGTTPGVIRPALSLLDAFKQTQGSTTVTGWHGKMSYLRGTGIPRLSNWQRYKVGRWYVHFKDIYGIAPKGRIVK